MKKNGKTFLAISIRQGFTSPNLPIATFYQGDKEIVFLLDSGSDRNVFNKEALDALGLEYEIKENEVTKLHGVGGEQNVETCIMSFGTEDEKFTAEFLVTDIAAFNMIKQETLVQIHGILGNPFLKENNVVLDYSSLSAYSRK